MLLKKTPLHAFHKAAGAGLADFSGWEMPIQYTGIIAEHNRTRASAALFDVSHMGEFLVSGDDAEAFINFAALNDIRRCKIGQAQYNVILNGQGGIEDDIICYKKRPDQFMICVNAANIEKDFRLLNERTAGFSVTLEDISAKTALIALQGRHAPAILTTLGISEAAGIGYYRFLELNWKSRPITLARLGYTGEDGYEIACHAEHAVGIWQQILDAGKAYDIAPAGLGARDLLRLEVCFPLYGNDLDRDHNPYQSALQWLVKKTDVNFVGKQALDEYKAGNGIKKKLSAFTVTGKGIARKGNTICDANGESVGIVTSGSFSPILHCGIGMGRFNGNVKPGDTFHAIVGKREIPLQIQASPLVNITKS